MIFEPWLIIWWQTLLILLRWIDNYLLSRYINCHTHLFKRRQFRLEKNINRNWYMPNQFRFFQSLCLKSLKNQAIHLHLTTTLLHNLLFIHKSSIRNLKNKIYNFYHFLLILFIPNFFCHFTIFLVHMLLLFFQNSF